MYTQAGLENSWDLSMTALQNDAAKPTVIQPCGYVIWALNAVHALAKHVVYAVHFGLYTGAVRRAKSSQSSSSEFPMQKNKP
jgi:hypothetical protein